LRQDGRGRALAAGLCIAAELAAAGPVGAADPALVWRTIESAHFVVHYHEPLGDVARRVVAVAEQAHSSLQPEFRHTPAERTQIVISDETDDSNGFAQATPRNAIRLFAVAPSGLSSLGDHDDWLYSLTVHEYSHILHLDTIGGLPALYNRIFGKVWAPNEANPGWLVEGIATYEESRQSAGGRVRNALFDAELRMPVLSGRHLRIDQVSSGPRSWPHGNAAYLHGGHFLSYVFAAHGDDKLAALSWDYGSSPVPYGLNRSIRRATGEGFVELYAAWLGYLQDRYRLQREAVERLGRIEGHRLTFSGEFNVNPVFARSGDYLVWRQADGRSRARYRAMPTGGNVGRAREYLDLERGGDDFDLLRDGSVVLEMAVDHRGARHYQDLFVWRRGTGRLERLTHGLRAGDPAVSPDERQVAFVRTGVSTSELALMPLTPEAPYRVLWRGPGRWDQASAPAWSPDGERIAFTMWTAGGYQDLAIVDLETGRVRRLDHDRAIDCEPVFSPDGRYLYYASDRSGIYNIYARELASGTVHQVTNVLGAALSPALSPDGQRLVYRGFDADGHDLYELAIEPEHWLRPALYVDTRPPPTAVLDRRAATLRSRPYRPLETLAPRSYTASLLTDSFGSALQLATAGGDAVGHHRYDLALTFSTTDRELAAAGSYVYDRLWPLLSAGAFRRVGRAGGLIVDDRPRTYREEVIGLSTAVHLPVLRALEKNGELSLAYSIDFLRNLDGELRVLDPSAPLPQLPETDVTVAGLSVRWSYGDVRGHVFTLGLRDSQAFGLGLRLDHPALGGDFHGLALDYRWERYVALPWGTTAALALRLAGGIRTSDRRRAGGFALGGVPRQDLVQSLVDDIRFASTGYLRGYPPVVVTGLQTHLLNLEYRQELFDIERGLDTLPIYLRRAHMAGLLDAGGAWRELDPGGILVGLGVALRLDATIGYFLPLAIDLGYARGLMQQGQNETWLLLTGVL
jgi:hypothetical protein